MASKIRIKKLSDLLKNTLNKALIKDIKDPRLKLIIASDVELSKDLYHAKVYFSIITNKLITGEKSYEGNIGIKGKQ